MLATSPTSKTHWPPGAVSAGHVDAIAGVVRGMDQVTATEFFTHRDDLLTKANQQSVDTFGRSCRDLARLVAAEQAAAPSSVNWSVRRRRRRSHAGSTSRLGCDKTLLNLDPECDKILWTAVSAGFKQLRRRPEHANTPWAQIEVEAVLAACHGGDGTERVPSLLALCDIETLRSGVHANSICETEDGTPLPVEVIRRLACEAEIIPVILDGPRRSTRRRTRPTSGDTRPTRRLEGDAPHLHAPDLHGPVRRLSDPPHHPLGTRRTDRSVEPRAALRHHDHHLLHEGGWQLSITLDRIATWTRPDGTIDHTGTTIDRAPNGVAPRR